MNAQNFDTTKDTMLYPNENGPKVNQFVREGKIFNNTPELGFKWTDYLPISNKSPIVFEGFTDGYITIAFFDEKKTYISEATFTNGTFEAQNIPLNARFVARNLFYNSGSTNNPDVSEDAVIYTQDSLNDTATLRQAQNLADTQYSDTELFELLHKIITIRSENVIYGLGYIHGDTGYAIYNVNRTRTQFYDIRQVTKIVLTGWNINLPNSRWFYDENLQPIDKLTGVNGIFDFRDFPEGAVYFAFVTEMETIKLSGTERIQFVYGGDTEGLYFYKREQFIIFESPQGIDGQQLNGAGEVVNIATSSWTGLIPIGNGDLLIEGMLPGFQTKTFFDTDNQITGQVMINNGIIHKSQIPRGSTTFGFTTRTTALGDSRSTTKVYYVADDMANGGSNGNTEALTIPHIIPVVVGLQANIYKDNIRPNPINDETELFFNEGAEKTTTAANPYVWKTRELERSVQYMPTTAETVPCFIRMRDKQYRVLTQNNFSFVGVSADVGNGLRKTIILGGDSQIDTTFDGGKSSFAPFMKDLFEQNGSVDMVFVGQEGRTATIYGVTAGENREVFCPTEGYGSTTIRWLLGYETIGGQTSPFLNTNGDFDIQYYFENAKNLPNNPYQLLPTDTLDFFLTPSGTNDWTSYGRSPQTVVASMVELYSKVVEGYPDCKFIVGIPTLGSKLWSMDVRRKWSIDYYRALIEEFEKPVYAGKAYLAAAALWTDNLFASRQLRKIVEPYQRIVDTKQLLINKAIQDGMTQEQAEDLVNNTYNLKVEERVFQKWSQEYPGTNDVTHSGYVGAMQQADCYYSMVKYILSL